MYIQCENISFRVMEEAHMNDNINRMFPCTWYAVCFSKDVTNEPIKRRVVGKDLEKKSIPTYNF